MKIQRPSLEEVSGLLQELNNSDWVDWGLWGDEEGESSLLGIRAAQFEDSESGYLEEGGPPQWPTVQLQASLKRLLGRV